MIVYVLFKVIPLRFMLIYCRVESIQQNKQRRRIDILQISKKLKSLLSLPKHVYRDKDIRKCQMAASNLINA